MSGHDEVIGWIGKQDRSRTFTAKDIAAELPALSAGAITGALSKLDKAGYIRINKSIRNPDTGRLIDHYERHKDRPPKKAKARKAKDGGDPVAKQFMMEFAGERLEDFSTEQLVDEIKRRARGLPLAA